MSSSRISEETNTRDQAHFHVEPSMERQKNIDRSVIDNTSCSTAEECSRELGVIYFCQSCATLLVKNDAMFIRLDMLFIVARRGGVLRRKRCHVVEMPLSWGTIGKKLRRESKEGREGRTV